MMAVVIETTIGCVTVDLFTKERPRTCTNFLKLCKMKYYNFCLFHCVQSNFIAQTGDPTGTGNGGESIFSMIHGENAKYYEAEALPKIKHHRVGLVSMVNCGNNMLGSQFFFTLGEDLHSLDGEHCVFGEVAEGLDVLIQLNEVICDEEHHPFRDIRITHTVILEDPFDDPPNLLFPDRSPEPTEDRLKNGRIAPDEEIDDTKGKTAEEVKEMVQKREAKARATILEIVGDIPDADIAPPENILFVCKLNPVTTDEDLEIIFGRFGDIKSCEVIKDKKTGDSLQYAFIEFAEKESCEKAYFKMDNVLIDDRRIHVDFSQSVAKMRWRGKGKGVEYLTDDKQKHSHQRPSKERDSEKREPSDRKRHASRSKSPSHSRQRNQEERNTDAWEKYQGRKEKDRDQYTSSYKKARDSCDSRSRVYEDKPRGYEYYGQRSYDRNREGRDLDYYYKKDSRQYGSRDPYSYGRNYGFERQMDYMASNRRDRSRAMGRSERKYSEYDERKRSSKESSSKLDKRSDLRGFYGEYSRYGYEKGGPRNIYRQRRGHDKHYTHSQRYGHDGSSENEEKIGSHERRRRLEEDRIYTDIGKRGNYPSKSDVYQFRHSGKSASDDQGSYKNTYKDDVDKDRVMSQGSHMDSDVSGKYESNKNMAYISKDYHDGSKPKKGMHKVLSKHGGRDTTRRSLSLEKTGKENVSKNKKITHKRKRNSSCSSYGTDHSYSSSGSSSSSESDDSDAESDSDDSESHSSSSSSTDRKVKVKKKKNKKQILEPKKYKSGKSGHKKRHRSSSDSSRNISEEDTKNKRKHKKRKDSSSSERKVASRGRGQKFKKKSKKNLKKKKESSESSSEESSSSSGSYVQRKSHATKRKKKLKKGVVCKKDKAKKSRSSKNKGKKSNVLVSSKKKKKRNDSISSKTSDSSDDSESGSSQVEHKHRKDQPTKEKDLEPMHDL